MKNIILSLIIIATAMTTAQSQYVFTDVKKVSCTNVKSQDRTGTCWSFATASFIESELMRMGHGEVDLSEMFVVRNIYRDKAFNYVYRQGKANFSQGSLGHDLMRAFQKHGAIPESVYAGRDEGEKHNHSEMEKALKGMLDGVIKSSSLSEHWPAAVEGVLDAYLGEAPETFTYNQKTYTPETFAASLNINADDYINFTSFTHHPYYGTFILEIPDNYSNGSYYNVPLSDLLQVIDNAIANGYSVAWDGDVSEEGFSGKSGIAVLPSEDDAKPFEGPVEEIKVTQDLRQAGFESYATTDDHLMHLVGTAVDQNNNPYYIIKNSWGEISPYKGFVYMSRPYVAMKTISIMVHKEAVPASIRKKLKL